MKIETIQGITLGMVIVLGILFFMHEFKDNQIDRFKISELTEGVGIGICTASVNSKALLCENEPSMVIPLYSATQESLDKDLENCVNAELITSNHCIGEHLEIRGNS